MTGPSDEVARVEVVHVITTLTTGGAERQLEMLVRRSRRSSAVVTLYGAGPVADSLRAAGHRVEGLHATGWRKPLASLLLARRLRRLRPDVVHVHLLSGQLLGIPAARLASVPVIVSTEHSLMDDSIEGRPLSGWLRLLYLGLERMTTHTLAVSETTAERLHRWGVAEGRVSVATLGIDLEALAHDPAGGLAVRAELGIDPSTRVIGAVGRLVPVKRMDVVLHACAELLREGALLLVAGSGPDHDDLVALARTLGIDGSVHWLGDRDAMGPVLSALDVLVSASADETFGMAVVEGLGNGLPVVYVECPALEELDEPPARAVRVAPTGDPAADAAGLGSALAEVLAGTRPGSDRHAVPASVVERYGAGAAARRVDAVHDRLLAGRPRRRRPVLVAVVALLVAAALVGGALAAVGLHTQSATGFVTRTGAALRADGEPIRFVGFNLYDAAASDVYSCSPATRLDDAGLDAAMQQVADARGTVVRFWAYQTYTAGGTDFSGVDRVIDAARAYGLRVLPVLEDGPGDCSTGEPGVPLSSADGGDWYVDGYRTPYGDAAVSYRDYVALMARHYRDEPVIAAWSLMNEAETTQRDADDHSVLVDFARDVSSVVHAADPHHLVTLGTQSNGAPGASGADFADVYGLDGLDLAEVHDWGRWGSDTEAMPGADADGALPAVDRCQDRSAPIACSFALARVLDKPLVVGESGIATGAAVDEQQRADLLGAKVTAALANGADGYLVWQLNSVDTDGYGVLIGSDDPLFAVLDQDR